MKLLAASASAFALAMSLATITTSQAMPIAPLNQTQAASGEVIRVADGCGRGFHRGPYGYCRPLYSCPRGWHPGPYGRRCFRN
ncbi:hypothetical protein FHT85_001493 [Rhizobium sp. BK312]|uniref:GCG_CRPN prefix-to-repeats domain-containing protein n=1 Tax=Rhizobium sp. BK312 TaxID=2587080 RepID=UPI000DD59419|nr:hypothetical protein [Rhizobium sp. BK312]MBB3424519.1 hypothetical protein [Rhizobium sp. BK312]